MERFAVNTDLRLSIGFRDHAKIVKLHKLLREAGVASIVTLWAYVAAYRPKGVLSGMDIADVEIASRWLGENGAFVETVHCLRLMDCPACKTSDSWEPHEIVLPVAIHDWEDWQPWAFRADERSALAREKARKRWDKEKAKKEQVGTFEQGGKEAGCKLHKEKMLLASKSDAAGNATASKIDAPLLSFPLLSKDQKKDTAADAAGPLLSLTEVEHPDKGNGGLTPKKASRTRKKTSEYPPEVLELWQAYCDTIVKVPAKKADALRNIIARLKEGYTIRQLGIAMENYSDTMPEDPDRRYHPNNFFGQKAYFLGFLPEADPGHAEAAARG